MSCLEKASIVCAALHFIAAHESACNSTPVDFGSICTKCSEWDSCHGRWIEKAASLFDAAGVHPQLLRTSSDMHF